MNNKNENVYFEIQIKNLEPSRVDNVVMEISNSFGPDGIQEFSLTEAEVDEILGERAYSGGDVPESVIDEIDSLASSQGNLIIYWSGENSSEVSQKCMEYLNENYPGLEVQRLEKEVEDWNEEWRKNFKTIEVSDSLKIVPSWEKENNPGNGNVYIYPGMGFGTGNHETTFLCLKLFENHKLNFEKDLNILDFGCGSGILGVAAKKLTKCRVDYCDIDDSALENCRQNIILNDLDFKDDELILRKHYSVHNSYNLIFANILLDILIKEKTTICDSLNDGGVIIVSGLLNHQVGEFKKAYSEFETIEKVEKGDWSALIIKEKK